MPGSRYFLKLARIEQNRAGRLTNKISDISARISDKESEGNHPREVAQLQIAHDYFIRNLQAYENYKTQSTKFNMTPPKSPETKRYYLTGYSINGSAQYDWR